MREERDGRVMVETVAEQDGNQIVRNAEAELSLGRRAHEVGSRAAPTIDSMLSERQQMLLRRVVEAHVEIGQPVGSKWLSEREDVRWSPSTIRYELAALEELGYLNHPHTSAGRVPTDAGLPPVRRLGAARAAARSRPGLRFQLELSTHAPRGRRRRCA